MRFKRIFTGAITAIIASSALILSVSADLLLTPDDMQGLTFVSNPEKEVKFANRYYDGVVGGEDSGAWILGGDNQDTGISIEMLREYNALEIDYECDYVVEGIKFGFVFKVHIAESSRLTEEGGYVFNDYLPATWVPYGPQGEKGKGVTVNSLDTIYQTNLTKSGTISVPTATLLEAFDDDSDYIMGIGLGVFNDIDLIPEIEIEDAMPYKITVTSVRLADEPNANAGVNLNLVEPEPESEPDETITEETTAAETTTIEETTEAAATTTAAADETETDNSTLILIICIVAAVIIIVVVLIIISSKKKK